MNKLRLMILCLAALGALPTQQAFAQALRYGSQGGTNSDDYTINADNSWNYSKLRLQTGPYIAWNIRSFNEELFFQFDNTSNHASDGRVAIRFSPNGNILTYGNIVSYAKIEATNGIKSGGDISSSASVLAQGSVIAGSGIESHKLSTFHGPVQILAGVELKGINNSIVVSSGTSELGLIRRLGQPMIASSNQSPIIFAQSDINSLSPLNLSTSNATERMRIAENGNVGIGTPAPSQKLEVNGNIKTTGMLVGPITTPLDNTALQVRGSLHVDNSAGDQVFHVSSGKQLVFVGKDAYTKYLATLSATTGEIQSNNFSLWVSKGIVTEDIAFADVTSWSDYVFKKDFKLRPLSEVSSYIQKEGHLPGMPSEEEVKQNGYHVHDMVTRMLAKIEELTLYSIKQQEEIERLKTMIESEKNLQKKAARHHSSNQR